MKKILLLILILSTVILVLVKGHTQNQGSDMEPVPNDSSHLYFRNSEGVYIFQPRDCGFLGCNGPDTRTFNEKYRQIPEADSATFQILINPRDPASDTGMILARDKAHVFYEGRYVPTGDVNTLQIVGMNAKDKENVYFHGIVINGLNTESVQFLGLDFIADRNGLYLGNSSQPRKAALVDRNTFKLLPRPLRLNKRDYVLAEDQNFYYWSNGGSYRADTKPNLTGFKKLGCGYYNFNGRIYYSLYEIAGADSETFRVLGKRSNPDQDVELCESAYAIDQNHRYEFEQQVRADDEYRNHQIDLLMANTTDDRKSLSKIKQPYICIPEYRPGTNFGFSQTWDNRTPPGTIKFLQYVDAGILEAEMLDGDGRWQPLPTLNERVSLNGCNSVGVARFEAVNVKPWFRRRDPKSISLVVNQFGEDHIYIVSDASYSIKLRFSKSSLIKMLRSALAGSRVTPFEDNVAGWGSGWILENKFFLDNEQVPEVWIPLKVKGARTGYEEGENITVGFKYSGGQFECIDKAQCSAWQIPQTFKAALN
ncbi:MAG TPA: DKNYY domain-containing protein [Pyrinomonadaceae bacterium]